MEVSLNSCLLSARGQAEFNSRGGTMQDCSSLLICHLCLHCCENIDNDDSDSPEGINECHEEMLPSKGTGDDSGEELVPPYAIQIQWDGLAKFDTVELVASNFVAGILRWAKHGQLHWL